VVLPLFRPGAPTSPRFAIWLPENEANYFPDHVSYYNYKEKYSLAGKAL